MNIVLFSKIRPIKTLYILDTVAHSDWTLFCQYHYENKAGTLYTSIWSFVQATLMRLYYI